MQSEPVPVRSANRFDLKVLIVDESAASRTNERSLLQSLGFIHFVEASDGAQAIAAVSREKFDLIVTDYNLATMDGLGLVCQLRDLSGAISVPIIMVTTETEPIVLEAARNLGVVEIFDKDFPIDQVRQLIDRLFLPAGASFGLVRTCE